MPIQFYLHVPVKLDSRNPFAPFPERIREVWMIYQPRCRLSHKSRFARQQVPTTHGSFHGENKWLSNELQNTRTRSMDVRR